jgi:hypothetical protein
MFVPAMMATYFWQTVPLVVVSDASFYLFQGNQLSRIIGVCCMSGNVNFYWVVRDSVVHTQFLQHESRLEVELAAARL